MLAVSAVSAALDVLIGAKTEEAKKLAKNPKRKIGEIKRKNLKREPDRDIPTQLNMYIL